MLRAPSGRAATLRRADMRPGRNLRTRYTLDSTPELHTLVGESVSGDWTLCVIDLARIDEGRLESWRIDVRTQ